MKYIFNFLYVKNDLLLFIILSIITIIIMGITVYLVIKEVKNGNK